jgi:hypothetical protein
VKIGKFFELLKSLLLHGSQAPAAQITWKLKRRRAIVSLIVRKIFKLKAFQGQECQDILFHLWLPKVVGQKLQKFIQVQSVITQLILEIEPSNLYSNYVDMSSHRGEVFKTLA